MMKSITQFPKSKIRFVFTDIDDTLTEDGRLQSEAFDSLWQLYKKNIHVVPITGRPAGWCELIARQWPVAGVVGENGGLYFRLVDRQMKRHFFNDAETRNENQIRLEKIKNEVLQTVPGSAVASDQFCRMMDLAIDFCEDVEPLPASDVQKIVSIFEKHGAVAKVSSIHVNGWFGKYDKLSMCKTFCKNEFGVDLEKQNAEMVFVGDSPNDEPMFEFFENSIGVANIKNFITQIKSPPKFVTSKPGGLGFAEAAKIILSGI